MSGAAIAKQPGGRAFVTTLRTPHAPALRVGAEGGWLVTVRVQFEPLWDAVAIDARVDEPISALVNAALAYFKVGDVTPGEFITKLNGWEVKGDATVESSGAKDGSTFLVSYRYRRAVR